MRNWGSVVGLSSFLTTFTLVALSTGLSRTAISKTVQFYGTGHPEATLKSSAISNADSTEPSTIQIQFVLPGVELEPAADGFSTVSAKNLYSLDVAGTPDVGVTGALFIVPPGYEPVLNILTSDSRSLSDVILAPAQRRFRCDCDDNKGFSFNSTLYRSNELFPASVATLENVGNFQNVRLARVRVQPIQQSFMGESVLVTTSLRAEVTFVQKDGTSHYNINKSQNLSPLAERLLSQITPNSADLIADDAGPAVDTMIVFTFDDYAKALAPFIEWKRLRGIDVRLFTLSEVGGTKEKAKAFLQKLYDEAAVKPSYLLVVGDKATFPAFEETTSTENNSQVAITDYPYSLLSGSDEIPDLLYGRLLVSNETELKNQLSKIIAFEKSPEKDNWYTRGTTIASNEGDAPSDKDYALTIQAALKKYTYTELDSFFQGDMTAKEAGVLDAVNQGRSWITYFGHGSGTSWGSLNDKFDLQSIEKLTNGRHPIIVDVACANANFRTIDVPFGKAWMVQTNGGKPVGAVGYYGGSVNISWHPPAIMATGIAKAHFEKPVNDLGGSVLAGQLFLIEQKGKNNQTLDNLRWYNLFGDPSLLLRTATPQVLTVEKARTKRNFQVRVTSSGTPVKGAVVSVIDKVGKISSIKTNEDGSATVPVAERLIVTGYNLETLEIPLLVAK